VVDFYAAPLGQLEDEGTLVLDWPRGTKVTFRFHWSASAIAITCDGEDGLLSRRHFGMGSLRSPLRDPPGWKKLNMAFVLDLKPPASYSCPPGSQPTRVSPPTSSAADITWSNQAWNVVATARDPSVAMCLHSHSTLWKD